MTAPLVIRLDSPSVNLTYSTDWHLSDRPPGKRTPGYLEEILQKLRWTAVLTGKIHGAHLCGADVFHNKYPRSEANTFSLLRAVACVLRMFPGQKVYGGVGNHDLYMDRADSLPSQPLGALIGAGVYHDLTDQSVIFENEDGSVRVLVDSFMYAEEDITLERVLNAPPRPDDVQYRIAILHAYGNPGNAGSMFGHRTIGYHELADSDYDLALWGHDHSRERIITDGNTTHIRLGSLSRASLAEDEVDRPVSVAVLSFGANNKVSFQEKEVPVQPLEVAFTNAAKPVEKANRRDDVTQFLADMDESVDSIEGADPLTVMTDLCPKDDPNTLSVAKELCKLA